MIVDENNLIFEFNQGNRYAFATIYENLYAGVFYYAKSLTPTNAADLTADAFHKLWEMKQTFKSIGGIKSWLTTVVHNAYLNSIKTSRSRKEIMVDFTDNVLRGEINWWDDEEQTKLRNAFLKLLEEGINRLPSERREICQLAFLQKMNNLKIAELLKTNERKIRYEKSKILAFLKEFLEKGAAIMAILASLLS
ncbi:MAG: sigma-70 family RNA polymerase sigma factor [Chitinophagaceae bacterium]